MDSQLTDSTYPVTVCVTVSPHGGVTCTSLPDTAEMPPTPNVTIVFTLTAPAGWKFQPQNAIVVQDGASQFPNPSVTSADGLTTTLLNLNLDGNSYNYTAYPLNPSGECLEFDPVIKNGGPPGCDIC